MSAWFLKIEIWHDLECMDIKTLSQDCMAYSNDDKHQLLYSKEIYCILVIKIDPWALWLEGMHGERFLYNVEMGYMKGCWSQMTQVWKYFDRKGTIMIR